MNKLKQKIFGYFNDNKVLSYITVIVFIFMMYSWIVNMKEYLFGNLNYFGLFTNIITLLFIINLTAVYLYFPPKAKICLLLIYSIVDIVYYILTWNIYRQMELESIIWAIVDLIIVGVTIMFLNNKHKNIFFFISIIICIIMNHLFNPNIYGSNSIVGLIVRIDQNPIETINYIVCHSLHYNFTRACVVMVIILLFIPIFKNQCPQCGFKNTKQAKFCGKCGHNLTERVFSLPIKK